MYKLIIVIYNQFKGVDFLIQYKINEFSFFHQQKLNIKLCISFLLIKDFNRIKRNFLYTYSVVLSWVSETQDIKKKNQNIDLYRYII